MILVLVGNRILKSTGFSGKLIKQLVMVMESKSYSYTRRGDRLILYYEHELQVYNSKSSIDTLTYHITFPLEATKYSPPSQDRTISSILSCKPTFGFWTRKLPYNK